MISESLSQGVCPECGTDIALDLDVGAEGVHVTAHCSECEFVADGLVDWNEFEVAD